MSSPKTRYQVVESIRHHGLVSVYHVVCYGADGVRSIAFDGKTFYDFLKANKACDQLNNAINRLSPA